jgi:glycosyltransferase involved in cell wall biosynthesis
MISYDCPRGPGEIIIDGQTGRLVPNGDGAAYTQALRDLLTDEAARRRMGAASYDDARTYEMDSVIAQWEQLISSVREEAARRTRASK